MQTAGNRPLHHLAYLTRPKAVNLTVSADGGSESDDAATEPFRPIEKVPSSWAQVELRAGHPSHVQSALQPALVAKPGSVVQGQFPASAVQ